MGGRLLGQLNCFSKKNKQKKHPKRHESNGNGGGGESSDAQTDYSLSLFGSNSSSPTGRGNSASHNNNASDAMNRNPYNHDDDTITMDPDYKQIKSGADSISNASGAVGTVDQSLTNFSANTDIFGTVSPSPFGAAPFGVAAAAAAAAFSSSSSPNIAIDGSDPYSGMEMEYNPSGNNSSASSSSSPSSSASHLIQSPVPHRQTEELLEIYAPPGKLGLVIDRTEYQSTPVVYAIKDTCPVRKEIRVGDQLVAVDDADVREMNALEVSKLLSRKSGQGERKLMFVRCARY